MTGTAAGPICATPRPANRAVGRQVYSGSGSENTGAGRDLHHRQPNPNRCMVRYTL